MKAPAPVIVVTDLRYTVFDPADLFDLAFLHRSSDHDLRGICLSDTEGDGRRVLDALSVRTGKVSPPVVSGAHGLIDLLQAEDTPVNLMVTSGYATVASILATNRPLFREKIARLFLVGGHANNYTGPSANGERLPIDPRLRDRHPDRFSQDGDPRIEGYQPEFAQLLTSGEGVIWLPRDISLWRYAAPGMLEDGGPVSEFLLRELFWYHLTRAGGDTDRYDAAASPVLLSSLPALLLAVEPDPFAWMRLFRVVTARVETNEAGTVQNLATQTESPNLYVVVAIDSAALSKLLTARLRDHPLTV